MDFEVNRNALDECRIVERPDEDLKAAQARLRVEAFALTANNLTYAVAGDLLSYWSFFPAEDPWGRIPAWGFAEVVESAHPDIEVGHRVYGYVPMSERFVITGGRIGPHGFSDLSPHRAALAAAYNRYTTAVAGDPAADGLRMVLHPLFVTAFLIDDYLDDNDRFGAEATVITSASSRTAIGTAWCLARREGHQVIGLTSAERVDQVAGLGVYTRVLAYEDLAELEARPTALVDIAGGAALHVAVHRHLADDLVASLSVGKTHVGDRTPFPTDLPGATAQFFFAPGQISKRAKDWGRAELDARLEAAWTTYAALAPTWLAIQRDAGPEALEAAYRDLLANTADPSVGRVLTLATDPAGPR